ncbi:reverse transcriptase domain-containing protein [Tanacetum coccineum]
MLMKKQRVKVNCTSKDTLQQASTSGTQSDNAPVYDSDGSTEVSELKGTTKGTRTNTMFTKQSILGKPPSSSYKPELYSITPFPKSLVLPKVDKTNALSKLVTSNLAPSTQESKVVKIINVIAPRIFRTNPSKTSTVDNVVPNKPVKTSIRIKPITVSQPNVIHNQQATSDSNGFPSTIVNNTAKTKRPHPRSNSNTDRVPFKSMTSFLSNNDAFGIVVRDSTGCLRYVLSNCCHAISPTHVEIIAVHSACSLAFNRGWLNAIVESDSQVTIALSSLESPPPWSLAALVDDIRLWSSFMQLSFLWVNRERNQAADWVARYAFSNTLEFSWDATFPEELTSLSRSDMYQC